MMMTRASRLAVSQAGMAGGCQTWWPADIQHVLSNSCGRTATVNIHSFQCQCSLLANQDILFLTVRLADLALARYPFLVGLNYVIFTNICQLNIPERECRGIMITNR